MSLNPKNYVTVDEFKENKEESIIKYIKQKQFFYENPINISEIKDLIGDNYRIWMIIYTERMDLIKKNKILKNKLLKFSYLELLINYSFLIEKESVNNIPYEKYGYLINLNKIFYNLKNTKNDETQIKVSNEIMFFLSEFIDSINLIDLFNLLISLYINDRIDFSGIKKSILVEILLNDDDRKINMFGKRLLSIDKNSTEYFKIKDCLNYLKNNKQKFVDILLRKEPYNKEYKKNVLLKLQERYNTLKINFYRDSIPVQNIPNFNNYGKIFINYLSVYTYIQNDFDNTNTYISSSQISKEILSYYFIKFENFKTWENIPLEEYKIVSNIISKDMLSSFQLHFKRVKYKKLIKAIKLFFSKLYYEFNKNNYVLIYQNSQRKDFYLGKEIFQLNNSDKLLETLIVSLNAGSKLMIPGVDYQFFLMGEYVYTNEFLLAGQNYKDHLISYMWNNSLKNNDDNTLQKKIHDYARYFEKRVLNRFTEANTLSSDIQFDTKCNIKYKLDEINGEIDILTVSEKVIVFCEVKSSYVRNSYDNVIENISNKLNGKATTQLNRVKENINNSYLLKQLEIIPDDIKNKEIVYLIVTNTPDFLGQSNEFPIVDELLLGQILNLYINNNMELSFEESYEFLFKNLIDELLETHCKRENEYELFYNYYHNQDFKIENCKNNNSYRHSKNKARFVKLFSYLSTDLILGLYSSNFHTKMNINLNMVFSESGIIFFLYPYKIIDGALIAEENNELDKFLLPNTRYLILVKNQNKVSCLEAFAEGNGLFLIKDFQTESLGIIEEGKTISMIIIEMNAKESKVIQFDDILIELS
ncbi:MAG: hypothetical protein ACPKNR_01800 [Pleomorphochaeta sp.]